MRKILKACLLLLTLGSTVLIGKASAAPDWKQLSDGSTNGRELGSGYYYVTRSISFSNSSANGSGLSIADGASVHIFLPKGVTLTATGGRGSGRTGGGAGIYLPAGSSLYLEGYGTVKATGGRAADGERGGDGSGGSFPGSSMYGGQGGYGGAGGGGAGAGIGTVGGVGASRTDSPSGSGGCSYLSDISGVSGNNGNQGGSAASMGSLFVNEHVTVDATGGKSGNGGGGGSAGYSGLQRLWEYNSVASGGGGGGGGAGGGRAADIGTGGSGGGSGGSGATGDCTSAGDSFNDDPDDFYNAWAGGGSGGYGSDSNGGANGSMASRTTNAWGSNNKYWGLGRNGGGAGSHGNSYANQSTDFDYVLVFNVMDRFGGDVKQTARICYEANTKWGSVTVSIPTMYAMGFTDVEKYLSPWNTESDGSGDQRIAYGEHTIRYDTNNLYAEWRPYQNLFPEGDGTRSEPFVIEEGGLLTLADYVNNGGNTRNVFFRQEGDIHISDVLANAGRGPNWTPIGHTCIFEGDYDGGGYMIQDGSIVGNSSMGQGLGVFGIVSGSIHNLAVKDINVSSVDQKTRCGAIAGILWSDDEQGVAGWMRDCFAVTNTVHGPYSGSLVGEMLAKTSMSHCLEYNNNLSGSFGGFCSIADNAAQIDMCFTRGGSIAGNGYSKQTNCEVRVSESRMASGAITWLLNDKTPFANIWYQDLSGTESPDAMPVLSKLSSTVYYDGTNYSNEPTGSLFVLEGKGTLKEPFLVGSPADLEKIAEYCNQGNRSTGLCILQTADIDLNGQGMTPIGNGGNCAFDGYYNGGGHSIRNGNIRAAIWAGVFGVVSGTVTRLCVEDCTVSYTNLDGRAGGIAARLIGDGKITNCFVRNTKVTNNIRGVAGGITSDMFDYSAVRNCLVYKTEVSATRFGYICGDTKENTLIDRCFTDGNTLVTSVLSEARGSVTNSTPSETASTLGTGEIAFALNNENNTNPAPAWYQNINRGSVLDETPVLSSEHAMVFRINGIYTNDGFQIGKLGKGTKEDPYKIATPADFENIIFSIGTMKRSNFHILQTADIDLADSLVVPIATLTKGFEGHYDGGGHVIRNLQIASSNADITEYLDESLGLFNNISGVVENLGIENCTFKADEHVTHMGTFAGKLTGGGQLRNCYATGCTVDYNGTPGVVVGALVGELADSASIEACYGFQNTVAGQNDGRRRYGHIVGNISSKASANLVFTDGIALCAERQAGAANMRNSEAKVDSIRFYSGEICYLLSGSKSDKPTWRQTIRTDQSPVLSSSRKVVYRHNLEEQTLYTNSDAEPAHVMVVFDPNHDEEAAVPVYVFKLDDSYYTPSFKLAPHAMEQDYYYFAGWNTQADGRGTFYPQDGELRPNETVNLYAMWENKVPADGETKIESLREDTIFFKVYDNGGYNKPYGYDYSGKLTLSAPADHFIRLTGTISTEAFDSDGNPTDYLKVYDGDDAAVDTLVNEHAVFVESYGSVFSSSTDGAKEDIGRLMSSGEEMTLEFVTNSDKNYYGLDLTATVLPIEIRRLGQGSKDDPFRVASVEDMRTVDQYIQLTGDSKIHILQTADIDMQGVPFTPLASSVESFEGTYDGGGFAIRNMLIDQADGGASGLFRNVSGVVERLGIEGSIIKGGVDDAPAGLFAGRLSGHGVLRHCYAVGDSLSYQGGNGLVGALVGEQTDTSRIESCYTYKNIFTVANGGYGAIAGDLNGDATQHLVFTDGASYCTAEKDTLTTITDSRLNVSNFTFRSGEISHRLNSIFADSIVWRQTIGSDSLPSMNPEADIVYFHTNQDVQGYTNVEEPTLLNMDLSDIVTGEEAFYQVFKGTLLDFSEVYLVQQFFQFKGWNTIADGSGTFYPKDTLLVYDEALKLYTQWDMIINLPKDEGEKISQLIPMNIPFAKVYDDGGSDNTYTAGTRYLTLTAPEGRVLQLKGTVAARTADGSTPKDYLAIYDGRYSDDLRDYQKLANDSARSGEGWKHLYYSTAAGKPYDIGTLSSSGDAMTIVFHTEGQDSTGYSGLDLTVTAVPVDSAVSVLGQGTEADPYKVTTWADLKNLASYSVANRALDFSARQMADIDLEGLAVEPLFNDSLYFAGHYDGGGHVVRNLKIDGYKGPFVGLFGIVSGTVEQLGIENSSVKAVVNDARTGALVAQLMGNGLLRNCYAAQCSVAYNDVRGVVGALVGEQTDSSRIENCFGFQNVVSGYTGKDGQKRYGYIAGDVAPKASQNFVVTDGPALCSDALASSERITNAYDSVAAERFASGEVCYLINGNQSDNIAWHQTLGTDSYPVGSDSHGIVFYHQLGGESLYTNNSHSDIALLHLVDIVDSLGNRDVEVLKGVTRSLADLTMEHEHFVFKGWNTQADGTGTAYATDDKVEMNDELTLYSQWDMEVVMPKDTNDTISLAIPQHIAFARVFDDGGSDSTYTVGTRLVTLTAPEGFMLQLKGTVATRCAADEATAPIDYLAVYDGTDPASPADSPKLTNSRAKSGEGWQHLYYSTIPGETYDIGVLTSSGREMTIVFHADGLDEPTYEGLNLTVTPVPLDSAVMAMGKGTEAEPLMVATRADLRNLADFIATTDNTQLFVKQIADIDMTGMTMKAIGSTDHPFLGTYDGGGHTVTLDINSDAAGENALFGCIGEGASIKDLVTTGSITTTAIHAGGIVSQMRGGTLSRCYSTVTIHLNKDRQAMAGGLVGMVSAREAVITDCAFAGCIDKGSYNPTDIGGIVGMVINEKSLTISNCYVAGSHTASLTDAIVADSRQSTTANNFYLATIAAENTTHATAVTAKEMASGKVCYLLNGSENSDGAWHQTLGTDSLPVLDSSHEVVLQIRNNQTAQTVFSNTSYVPETVNITLHHNDGTGKSQVILAYRQHAEEETNLEFALMPTAISFADSYDGKVVAWTEQADGEGAIYKPGDMIKPYNDMELYAQWDSLALCIPRTGSKVLNISKYATSIKVYDDGGPDRDYSSNCDGELRLIAPEGSVLQATGSITTGGWPGYGGNPYAYLMALDEQGTKIANESAKSWSNAEECKGIYWSAWPGQTESVGRITSPANELALKFISGDGRYPGLDLDVKVMTPPYFISSKEEFMAYAGMKGDIYLVQDVNLGEWTGSNFSLAGNFDGRGHTITYSNNNDCKGLFETVKSGASVKHLRVEANISTMLDCGGIAKTNEGTISDCHFRGDILKFGDKENSRIAGIATYVKEGAVVDHCSATGNLTLKYTDKGGVYPISNSANTAVDHWTWVSPSDPALYAAQADSAENAIADYPVYARGILDVTRPLMVMGNDTTTLTDKHLETLTIVDAQRFSCPTEVTVDRITYKRRGTGGAYEPWVLPFAYTVDARMVHGDLEFYRFVKGSGSDIQVVQISADETYQVAANEPLAFRSAGTDELSFQMRQVKDGTDQPLTLKMPADGMAAMMASTKDIARVMVTYDSIAPDRTVRDMMYVWNDSVADFELSDGKQGLQPFRYYLQYINKNTGEFENYEATDWARMQPESNAAPLRELATTQTVRRAPLAEMTDQGWQPIILDPRGSQQITAEMLADYDILGLWDLYDKVDATDPDEQRKAVTAVYTPALEGMTLDLALPLLVRAKRADVQPLVTEEMGREIDAQLTEAAEGVGADELSAALDEIHYWCATFGGRYDVWQMAMPESDKQLNGYGALLFGDTGNDQFFYRIAASDGYTMKPMSYCFTAYDARTFENLPLANDRIEIVVIDLPEELTGVENLNTGSSAYGSRNGSSYNLQGQKVDGNYHGIIIRNGRKIFVK